MKLTITHTTNYDYASPVYDSVNEIRLTPFTYEHQSCYQHAIVVEPNTSLFSYDDYFGNRVHAFSVNQGHQRLTIKTQMTVVTKKAFIPPTDLLLSDTDSWAWLNREETSNEFAEYLQPTSYTQLTPEVIEFAQSPEEYNHKQNVYDYLLAITKQIKQQFVYDPYATTVHTVVEEMLQTKRGVCQDFAHLMIAACRAIGIPARYVSGYHFIGDLQGGNADYEQASHAWVEAYVPGPGWCGFDPTNDELIGERYVKLAHGRDYRDIVPVKGVYRGASPSELEVTVDVSQVV